MLKASQIFSADILSILNARLYCCRYEKDISLSIVLLLREKLESQGIAVVLTRETDEDVSLPDRSKIANNAGANYFISIHCNSYEDDPSIKGFECYYYQSLESKDLAETITSATDTHSIATRKVKEEDYAVLRETAIPSVLIEVRFLTNTQERKNLLSSEYQELLAESIAKGILNNASRKQLLRCNNRKEQVLPALSNSGLSAIIN